MPEMNTVDRGMQLAHKDVGIVLKEIIGPVVNRNYFSGGTTQASLQVFGTGAVTLQSNANFVLRGENGNSIDGSTGPISVQRVPDPSSWVNVVGAIGITSTDGLTTVAVPNSTNLNYLRLIVATSTTDQGRAVLITQWS